VFATASFVAALRGNVLAHLDTTVSKAARKRVTTAVDPEFETL
jgi:hypothetical protein